jgi:hypothetical protein
LNLPAGSHTIEVRTFGGGGSTVNARVSGGYGYQQGELTALVLKR